MPQILRFSWEQKLRFVLTALAAVEPINRLCQVWQLSRQTAHKWRRRYQAGGPAGLVEHARAPHRRPHALSPHGSERIERLRRQHPRWGPKKLRAVLRRTHPRARLPATSTIGAALRRLGLIVPRRRRRLGPLVPARRVRQVRRPNDVWTVDFKGWFCTLNGQRCDPLTVRDLATRYGLRAQILPQQTFRRTQAAFLALFRRRGLPAALRMDNGSPFGSPGPAGLSRLSAWFISLGVEVQFIRPGHPEDNGSHEQWHRELKADTARPPAATLSQQAVRTTRWRRHYNQEHPHEALDQQVPADHYQRRRRRYRGRQPPRYPAHWPQRQGRGGGELKWQGRLRFVGEAFAGYPVALRRWRQGVWRVCFYHVLLGELHDADATGLRPAVHRRGGSGPRKV